MSVLLMLKSRMVRLFIWFIISLSSRARLSLSRLSRLRVSSNSRLLIYSKEPIQWEDFSYHREWTLVAWEEWIPVNFPK